MPRNRQRDQRVGLHPACFRKAGNASNALLSRSDPKSGSNCEGRAKFVLGTQGQLWSEYIPTAEHIEYMAFPRMCALAEVAWSPKELRVKFRPLDG